MQLHHIYSQAMYFVGLCMRITFRALCALRLRFFAQGSQPQIHNTIVCLPVQCGLHTFIVLDRLRLSVTVPSGCTDAVCCTSTLVNLLNHGFCGHEHHSWCRVGYVDTQTVPRSLEVEQLVPFFHHFRNVP